MEVVYVDKRWLCWEGANCCQAQVHTLTLSITLVIQRRKSVARV